VEILAMNTDWSEFLFVLIIAIIASLVLLASSLICLAQKDYLMTVICTILTVLFTALVFVIIHKGPDVTYQAKISDFNAVYKHGYKIISHDDKLYTIRKEEK
jgi:uncharacterized MnhB-related membrane protein